MKVAIIGGGVAGLTAAVYALRSGAEVTVFEQFGLGGLTATIDKIENFPSYVSVEGFDLASKIVEQATLLGAKTQYEVVTSLEKTTDGFVVKTTKGEYGFASVVVATGTRHNKLGFEDAFVGKGVSYCATCDGNFYKNKSVAVVGSGNTAVKEALYLAGICEKVTLVCPAESLTAEKTLLDALKNKLNCTVLVGTSVVAINGESKLDSIVIFDGEKKELDVSALFVAVGASPATDFIHVEGVKLDKGYVVVDSRSESTVKGLFSAGDCTAGSLKQIVCACGDGAKAGFFASTFIPQKLK